MIAICVLYYRTWDLYKEKKSRISHLLAAILATTMLIGLSYSKLGNWDYIFACKKQFVIAMIAFAGFYRLADVCIVWLYRFTDQINIRDFESEHPLVSLMEKHFFAFSMLVLIVCWSPYLISQWPGSVPYDGARQLRMFFGVETFSNHHPWLLTYIYGGLMKVGSVISNNVGVFLVIIIFYLLECLCYSEVCTRLENWGGKYVGLVSLIFYAIVPVFGAYAQTFMKDGIFSALFALYIVWCMGFIIESDEMDTSVAVKKTCRLIVTGILVCLTRNNGLYMVIPMSLMLMLLMQKRKRYGLIMLVAIFLSYSGLQSFSENKLGVEPGSMKEMLSIPFQQTARYLLEYPDDVTEEEAEAIQGVLSYKELAERYKPEISDHVKDSFKKSGSKKRYFKAWFSMFLRHPGVYIEATLHNTYRYYYLFYDKEVLGTYQFYIQTDKLEEAGLNVYKILPESISNSVRDYAQFWRKAPILSQLVNPAFYTWLLLLLAGYLCHIGRYKKLLFLVAPALNILICIASPVNGYLRYVLPLMACAPVLIYWTLSKDEAKEEEVREYKTEQKGY